MDKRSLGNIVILAEGAVRKRDFKTGIGVIRYGADQVVAIIDKETAGRDASEFIGCGKGIKIFPDLKSTFPLKPHTLLLGTSPIGGGIPSDWLKIIEKALKAGMGVISGMHEFLSENPGLVKLAREYGGGIWDVRKPVKDYPVARGAARDTGVIRILTVGSDCSSGKMTATFEMEKEMTKRGYRVKSIATGQSGIIIKGRGIPIDRIPGDFMAGAIEEAILEEAPGCDYLLIEGQGSINHPGYSGVALALLHGAMPQYLVFCHVVTREGIRKYQGFPYPPLKELIQLNEGMATPVYPARTIAVALNTLGLSDADSQGVIRRIEEETGLPTTDPVRWGAGKLVDALGKAQVV
ncbi:DUF1611 domain-containing protein [candidate division KSB1 bacterium]|nr:DUF1611 domain-containing protein [candidate division KSB1 bacterium]